VHNERGTTALGAGLLAVLAALWSGAGALVLAAADPSSIEPSKCIFPIEVIEQGISRLVCEYEPALSECGTLAKGDQVSFVDRACHLEPGGMQAGMRLVAGLPLVLNEVSAQELALLDGIGPSLSTAIVEYRDRVGRFEHVDELLAVRGIGKKRMNRLRRHLSCAKP
jgi:competence ComEA-like helix-hairpin-helix protein